MDRSSEESRDLNEWVDVAFTTRGGREFHGLITIGKKSTSGAAFSHVKCQSLYQETYSALAKRRLLTYHASK